MLMVTRMMIPFARLMPCQCCSGFGVSKGVTHICFLYFSGLEDNIKHTRWQRVNEDESTKKIMNLVTNVRIVG